MAKSLYICYFGVNEPLVNTQVIPYLRELTKDGHEITLLTFEPGEVDEADVRSRLAEQGIEWQWLRYHKRPSVPATLFDIANGVRYIRKLMQKHSFDILHARSHVPMMMAAISRKVAKQKPKVLFDIRGFLPEEYVDAGVWDKKGSIYRRVKKAEAWLMKEADGFVVLTEKAKEILAQEIGTKPVEVIPCCVDLDKFEHVSADLKKHRKDELGLSDRFVTVYVGSFGGWYLSDAMMDFFSELRSERNNAFALVLTQRDVEKVEADFRNRGFGEDEFLVRSVRANEVGRYLAAADLALSFITPTYSKQSSSPTKLAEYLASGVPVICNRGVGDVDTLLEKHGVGILLDSLDQKGYSDAIKAISTLGNVESLCREVAVSEFDLKDVGGRLYSKMYRYLIS